LHNLHDVITDEITNESNNADTFVHAYWWIGIVFLCLSEPLLTLYM
jgi:hypothetical protein